MPPLFDAYLFVDWNAAGRRALGRNAVWYAHAVRTTESVPRPRLSNPASRHEAISAVTELLCTDVDQRLRVLVGFDFQYGYPVGFAAALGLDLQQPWRSVWTELDQLISDDQQNRNNRFEVARSLNRRLGGPPGPFWGCPDTQCTDALLPTRSTFPFQTNGGTLSEFRLTEQQLSRAQPAWQLFGGGAVGGQTLVGIPRLAALRQHPQLAGHSRVWPFETGFRPEALPGTGPFVLHAEVYPKLVKVRPEPSEITDAAQVRTLVEHFSERDARGELAALLSTPPDLSQAAHDQALQEEGWILGA